jgi:Ras-related protein Rab-11A
LGIFDYDGPRYKIVVVGDGGVGKTALIERVHGHGFQSTYNITIGANISVYDFSLDENDYKFQLWDLAGQQRFDAVRKMFYRGCHATIFVFDQTRQESFKNLERWKRELFSNVGRKIPYIIVGNKNDLERNDVPEDLLKNYIEKCNSELEKENIKFKTSSISASAYSGENVKESFDLLASSIQSYIYGQNN